MSGTRPGADGGGPTIQAHRCFAGVAPENTTLAARTAAERFDASWIEVDVQPTADGTVVCFHDHALHETPGSRGITDARGVVWETPTETVLDAEVLDSGETVPTLTGLLDALPVDVGVNVELKNPGSPETVRDRRLTGAELPEQRALWQGFVDDVLAEIDGSDRPLVLSSFCEGAIAAVADRDPDGSTAVIVGSDPDEGRAIAERHDADAINARAGPLFDAGGEFVAATQRDGLTVNAWTVRTWTTFRDLTRLGVDGLIVDYPFLNATV